MECFLHPQTELRSLASQRGKLFGKDLAGTGALLAEEATHIHDHRLSGRCYLYLLHSCAERYEEYAQSSNHLPDYTVMRALVQYLPCCLTLPLLNLLEHELLMDVDVWNHCFSPFGLFNSTLKALYIPEANQCPRLIPELTACKVIL
jgi:hypothetical protein